jgi:hypothetical protein
MLSEGRLNVSISRAPERQRAMRSNVMCRGLRASLVVALLCIGATAGAATAKFDCDTAAKRFSQVDLPISVSHFRISGLVSSTLLRKNDEWAPKVSIYLSDGGEQLGGFSIFKQPAQPWTVVLRYDGKESNPVATVAELSPIPFTLDVNASSGAVDLTFGANQYHRSGAAFAAQQLTLSCSSGNFLFDQLSWEALPN